MVFITMQNLVGNDAVVSKFTIIVGI